MKLTKLNLVEQDIRASPNFLSSFPLQFGPEGLLYASIAVKLEITVFQDFLLLNSAQMTT